MEKKFKIGQVVSLKSGSPDMTVKGYLEVLANEKDLTKTEETSKVECQYFDGLKLKTISIEQELLILAKEQKQ